MMDHSMAISAWLTPFLLVIIAWYLKRIYERNEREHDALFRAANRQDARMAAMESHYSHLHEDMRLIKQRRAEGPRGS